MTDDNQWDFEEHAASSGHDRFNPCSCCSCSSCTPWLATGDILPAITCARWRTNESVSLPCSRDSFCVLCVRHFCFPLPSQGFSPVVHGNTALSLLSRKPLLHKKAVAPHKSEEAGCLSLSHTSLHSLCTFSYRVFYPFDVWIMVTS